VTLITAATYRVCEPLAIENSVLTLAREKAMSNATEIQAAHLSLSKTLKSTKILIALIAAGAVVSGCDNGSRSEVSHTVVTEAIHDCAKGPNASIDASNSAFKLTGTCERVTVKGGSNQITIESAKRIHIDGAKNIVDVGAADIIRVNGVGNTVSFKKKGVTRNTQDVVAIGDNNTLNQTN